MHTSRRSYICTHNYSYIKTICHVLGHVLVAKKDLQHTSVLFTGTTKSLFSTPHISITMDQFPSNLHVLCFSYTQLTYQIWRKSVKQFSRYVFLKIAGFSSHFPSSHRFKSIALSQEKQLLMDQFCLWILDRVMLFSHQNL